MPRRKPYLKKVGKPQFYPVLINLRRFPCLIVGGGKVAQRKVLSLLEFNARVTVVAPRLCTQLLELNEHRRINIIRRRYSAVLLEGFKIVFAATDNAAINRRIRRDCSDAGILLNAVDDRTRCDFILPANVKRGDLIVSVSSQGKAPFYAVAVKKRLERSLSPAFADIIKLAAEFRTQVLGNRKPKSPGARAKLFRKFAATDWEEILNHAGQDRSGKRLRQILKEYST